MQDTTHTKLSTTQNQGTVLTIPKTPGLKIDANDFTIQEVAKAPLEIVFSVLPNEWQVVLPNKYYEHPVWSLLKNFQYWRYDVKMHFQVVSHLQQAYVLVIGRTVTFPGRDIIYLMDLPNTLMVTSKDQQSFDYIVPWTYHHNMVDSTQLQTHETVYINLNTLLVPSNGPSDLKVHIQYTIENLQYDYYR